ncbi:LexA family protein [Altericroceibacterium endophyticum]|uniref:LexA repressor DNA-binding domain-containing protein n=1 Tax=Altericroceibacterium endophyticum TaxID=1808508 RepID=A0A6I4T4P0_9SPHN|nr:hypothetical protein [Altericroceibacterium endophyticum]MXO64880.1 hypothetical protein [Altericroceibacterium endophyticum]
MSVSATSRQLDALRFIQGYQEVHGSSPTLTQISEGLDLRSRGGVHRLVTGLEERSLIRRAAAPARSIEICEAVALPRAPDGAPLFSVTPKGISP